MKRTIYVTGFLATILLVSTIALATPPEVIRYQARLTDNVGVPLNGTITLTFAIFDVETGGMSQWSETLPGIVVENGVVDLLLGETVPLPVSLFSGAERYLEVTVDGATLTPRQRLASMPYAHDAGYASDAGTLNGRTSSEFLDTSATAQTKDGALTIAGAETFRTWTAGTDPDIDALLPGTNFGGLIDSSTSRHLTIAMRGNDIDDSFNVLVDTDFDGQTDRVGLTVNSRGRVGVGTSSPFPAAGLTVNGRIRIRPDDNQVFFSDNEINASGVTVLNAQELGVGYSPFEIDGNPLRLNTVSGSTVRVGSTLEVGSTTSISSSGNLSPATAPSANRVFPNSMIKGWADLEVDVYPNVLRMDGFNVASATYGPTPSIRTDIEVTWHTAFANATYVVMANLSTSTSTDAVIVARTTTGCTIRKVNRTTGSNPPWGDGDRVQIMVVGVQ